MHHTQTQETTLKISNVKIAKKKNKKTQKIKTLHSGAIKSDATSHQNATPSQNGNPIRNAANCKRSNRDKKKRKNAKNQKYAQWRNKKRCHVTTTSCHVTQRKHD